MPEQRCILFKSDVGTDVHPFEPLNVIDRTHDQRASLMEAGRHHLENTVSSGGGATARLLDNEGHGVRFVDEAQAPVFVALPSVSGVEEYAASNENAEGFRDQRPDPAHVEIFAAGPIGSHDALFDIGANRHIPVPPIRSIDRVFGRIRRNLHHRCGELELPLDAIERKDINTPPNGEDERFADRRQRNQPRAARCRSGQRQRPHRMAWA